MAKSIYLIGGSKGGVGKSLVTMATLITCKSAAKASC
jgi:MinD superfamily P-loop ATPase